MGAGKSRTLILDLEAKLKSGAVKNFLLTAPSGSYRNWSRELETWLSPELYKQLVIFVWVSGKSKPKDFEAFLSYTGDRPRALLMNIEALSRVDRAKEGIVTFLKSADTLWTVDESQAIKSPTSLRTKFILKIAPLAKYRRILTGLITPENPMNLFSQASFLDPKLLGQNSFFSFRARYAITKKVDFKKTGGKPVEVIVGFRNLPELNQKLEKFSYRVRTEDVVCLPPRIYMPIRYVEMTPEQTKMYAEMKRLAMTQIEGSYVTSQIAAGVLTKLHAILMGHAIDENGELHHVPSNRVNAVLELLEDFGGKALLWASSPHLLRKLATALEENYGPESVMRYWGETTSDERVENVERFQNDPKCRFAVLNQSVGGEGINLTAATLVCYVSNSWRNSERQQSEARAHRIGQERPVTYVDFAVEKSMEEKLIVALRKKQELSALVNGDTLKDWII
jgi:SNF2 family DNA or RNA helicase